MNRPCGAILSMSKPMKAQRGVALVIALVLLLVGTIIGLSSLIIVIGQMGKLFGALLFCLGPLALVAHLPRPSRTATRWFSHFVTVMSWPIFSGLLLSILVAMGREGAETGGYLAAVIASLLTAGMALATPRLASHVVGGTLENLIANGWDSAKSIERDATSPSVRDAMRTVVGGPARAADGHMEWRPGLPQRIAASFGHALAGVASPGINPSSMANPAWQASTGAAANPPSGSAQSNPPNVPTSSPRAGSGSIGTASTSSHPVPPANPPAVK